MTSPWDPWSWPLRTHRGPHGDLAYVESGGEGPPALFVHGLPTAKELWFPVLAALGPRVRAIVPDLIGYGASEKPDRGLHHREQAAALDALRAHLGLDRLALIAHDLGASVAVDYMRDHAAAVDRLCLMSPPIYPDFREPPVVRLLRRPLVGPALLSVGTSSLFTLAMRRGLAHPERLTARLHRAMVAPYAGRGGRRALRRNLWWGRPAEVFADYPAILRGITAPTLVLHGLEDPYIPVEHARRVARDVAGARVIVLDRASHFLPIDAPDEVAAALADHLGLDRSNPR